MLVGLGAVSTTFIAGGKRSRKVSLTGREPDADGNHPARQANRESSALDQGLCATRQDRRLVFGAWDIFEDSAYEAALHAGVLEKELLLQLKGPLAKIKPMKAVFDQSYVKRLNGTNVKSGKNKLDLANQLIDEIDEWKRKNKVSRVVMIWAASTEIFLKENPVHKTIESFEKAMKGNHKSIAPSMIYAYAALKSGIPFANGLLT